MIKNEGDHTFVFLYNDVVRASLCKGTEFFIKILRDCLGGEVIVLAF